MLGGCQSAAPIVFVAPSSAPPRVSTNPTAFLDQHPIDDPGAFARARALADTPPPTADDPERLATFYARRGRAAGEIGRAGQAVADLTRAAETSARTGRPDFEILIALAFAEIES